MENQTYSSSNLYKSIAIAWLMCMFALGFSGWLGAYVEQMNLLVGSGRYILQALVMSTLTISCIYWIRKSTYNAADINIGFAGIRHSLQHFGLGISLILAPLVITLIISELMGWASFQFNFSSAMFVPHLTGVAIVLLFEAIPEELVFRGYIYSNLNIRFQKWASVLLTTLLFALLPVVLAPIQTFVIEMDVNYGNSSVVTPGYVINMLVFGGFVGYLRILFGSIWVGIGFHLLFVYMNRMMGFDENSLIQIVSYTNESGIQFILISLLLLTLGVLLIYPKLTNKTIGWKQYITVNK